MNKIITKIIAKGYIRSQNVFGTLQHAEAVVFEKTTSVATM